jgi:prophage DNA circulation protein
MALPPWKAQLVPAMFRGAEFKVDANSRGSGRRAVVHEFPKRDIPYAEDMGRRARRFPITGYVVGPFYKELRDDLMAALEVEGPGLLILPTLGEHMVQVEQFTVRETRQAGGYAEFEMAFVEAGEAAFTNILDTASLASSAASTLKTQAVTALNNEMVDT